MDKYSYKVQIIMRGPLNSITYKHKDNKSDPDVFTNLKKLIIKDKKNFTKKLNI